jgi:hypothetical protein
MRILSVNGETAMLYLDHAAAAAALAAPGNGPPEA